MADLAPENKGRRRERSASLAFCTTEGFCRGSFLYKASLYGWERSLSGRDKTSISRGCNCARSTAQGPAAGSAATLPPRRDPDKAMGTSSWYVELIMLFHYLHCYSQKPHKNTHTSYTYLSRFYKDRKKKLCKFDYFVYYIQVRVSFCLIIKFKHTKILFIEYYVNIFKLKHCTK